ncbi:MAG: sodium:solute symporter family protein [Cyclobacteriaceae bacterium]|nr:sodium:solute symporter family protein [Cyclobacteriaceae bacterium]
MSSLDLTVLIVYFLGITAYGLWVARRTKSSDQYFRGGRSFKWWTMMGQAFGTGTHAEMPVAQAGASFSGGFATIWYQWKNLLITPFYWLIAPWYRRSDRTTVAEMVGDRYGKTVRLVYTIFAIAFFVFIMGAMLQGAAKVISVATDGAVSSNMVVVLMTVAFIVYSYFGGLVAAAHTEFIQGILIIILSFMLIPSGLREVGGFAAMREKLPEDFFSLFSADLGLGPFTLAMLALNGIIGITAQPHSMSLFATGNSERACRVGQTYGNFIKRFVTLGWALTGLIVAALVIHRGVVLEDPEHAFGYATRTLLAPGLVGLMIACLLAANMSSCSNFMVNLGALFVKDIYKPYFKPDISDRQSVKTGRLAGLLLTLLSVGFAMTIENVLSAFLFTESIAAFMGIMIFGGMLWKGANRSGALASVSVAFITYYVINYMEQDALLLIYKWKPAPFGWAMLSGFIALIVVSKFTTSEPADAINKFFTRLNTISTDDMEGSEKEREAGSKGMALILVDLPSWFKASRWVNFRQRYKEDWSGFLLAWIFVIVLVIFGWLVIQIGK